MALNFPDSPTNGELHTEGGKTWQYVDGLAPKWQLVSIGTGTPGAPGADGADGRSAYEVAVSEGFVGTVGDWLASLVGPAGADGADGALGADGATGPRRSGRPRGSDRDILRR